MMRAELLLPCALILLAGCGDEPNVQFDMDDDTTFVGAEVDYERGDEFAMLTENGAVKLGLTSDRVYFQVSGAVREHVDREIESGMEESDSRIARSIGSAVRRGVQQALHIDIDFDIDDIRDVDYRGGELVFDFVDEGDDDDLDNIEIDDEPITRSFSATDAQAFVDAFRRVKAGESLRADTTFEVRTGTLADTTAAGDTSATADSAGGGSF